VKKYSNIVFDLDGTISDSSEGIINAFRFSLEKMGLQAPQKNYGDLIGAPLHKTFSERFFKHEPEKVNQAIQHFREYYRHKGKFENKMYEGIPELLEDLHSDHQLYILTNKPESFAGEILRHFNIEKFFQGIYGLQEDATSGKEILALHMNKNIFGSSFSDALMVGDTIFDLTCAQKAGWDFCFASYGFGSTESLQPFSPQYSIDAPAELKNTLYAGRAL
jgi:phosphoglycolate phosphatase